MRLLHTKEHKALARATQEQAYSLARKDTLVIEDERGAQVCCHFGHIWLTQLGDSRDFVLQAGECFQTERRAVIVVQATQPAQLLVRRNVPCRRGVWRDLPARLLRPLAAPYRRVAANARMRMQKLTG